LATSMEAHDNHKIFGQKTSFCPKIIYKLFGVYHTTNFVHFSLPSLLLTTVSMKAIPRTPSATVGKSCSSAVGVRPSFLAETVSAKLRYILAKDSNNPSGCPAGIRVLCVAKELKV